MNFTITKFGDFAVFKYGKMPKKSEIKETGRYPIYSGYRYVGYYDDYNTEANQLIIVARGVGGTGDVKLTNERCYLTNLSISAQLDENVALPQYLYYYFSLRNLRYLDSGSAQSQITISDLQKVEIPLPNIENQIKLVNCLGVLDYKIRTNEVINNNLEQQAQVIFANEFISLDKLPEGWRQASLIDVADYSNGLAMQKYRPIGDESGIPVLKIKELRQGYCDDNSELCSPSIKSDYIVHDGDVIFSWSGSLLVDFWCGGICGLNQHLFKVTSSKYAKWFYYAWTKHHLDRFISVAADKATTMGHIKRDELAKAEVFIPNESDYSRIGALLQPIYDLVISNRIESKKLALLRDTILPKLMSGKLDISEIEF